MGERTYIKSTSPSTSRRGAVARLSVDVPLVLITASLLVIGLLMVYSASWDASLLINKPATYVFTRQVMWVGLGLAVAVFFTYFDYHRLEKYVVWVMLIVLVLLFSVLARNEIRFNASRALFNGSVQPAELAKLSLILYLSVWLSKRSEKLSDVKEALIPLFMILALVAGLILAQPDISATATIVVLGIMMFFLAGGDWKQLFLVIFAGALGGVAIVSIMPTGRVRLADYIAGLQNPVEGSYHIRRTFEAIIKGRLFGVGLGKADTKFTGLPLPHTDSIFAVIAEETGLIGSFLVILLFVLLIWRGLKIAKRAPDQLGSLIAFGLIGWIVIEALINIAVIAGLFPFAGNALPFISAGGSSMVTVMAAIGIVMNIARQGSKNDMQLRSQTSATVDLRGRDWRRSVSSADRYGKTEE